MLVEELESGAYQLFGLRAQCLRDAQQHREGRLLQAALEQDPTSGRVVQEMERIARGNGSWSDLVRVVAEVANGRVQKFRRRTGANSEFLVGKPVYAAWK